MNASSQLRLLAQPAFERIETIQGGNGFVWLAIYNCKIAIAWPTRGGPL